MDEGKDEYDEDVWTVEVQHFERKAINLFQTGVVIMNSRFYTIKFKDQIELWSGSISIHFELKLIKNPNLL
jgi:hypothetical protein